MMNLELFTSAPKESGNFQRLNIPFTQDGWKYRTDGRIIIRYKVQGKDTPVNGIKFPRAYELGWDKFLELTETWPAQSWVNNSIDKETNCPICRGRGRTGKIKVCGRCNGSGTNKDADNCGTCLGTCFTGGKQCNYCDRTGQVYKKPAVQMVDGRMINGWYDKLVRSLGDVFFKPTIRDEEPIFFTSYGSYNHPEIEGILMPLVQTK